MSASEALVLSRAMLTAAQASDWPRMEALCAERDALLRATRFGAEDRDTLMALSTANDHLLEVVRDAQRARSRDLRQLGRGRRAQMDYQALR
jgi:hypothetical protein